MDVSFVIPTLNEEGYIEKTLKAIKAQKTNLKFEIIVVDGMSEDKTVKISKKYARIVSQKTRGIADARNLGAKNAKGKLIVFVDADSLLPPDYLDIVWNRLQSDKKLVALTAKIKYHPDTLSSRIFWKLSEITNWIAFLGNRFVIGPNLAVWKTAFKKSGGFPDVPSEDYALARNLQRVGKIEYFMGTHCLSSARRLKRNPIGASFYYMGIVFTSTLLVSRFSLLRKIGRLFHRRAKYKPVR